MEPVEELARVRQLSDRQLLSGLKGALCEQRRSVAEVVAHLGEVEDRRLHLIGGYGSMFEYCSSHLLMSEDEAYRRIEVARLARRFPQLFPKLARGEISLSVAALLRSHLTPDNAEQLLADLSGKTVRQAREVLAGWFPRPDVASSIRKLPVRPVASAEAAAQLSLTGRVGSAHDKSPPRPPQPPPQPPFADASATAERAAAATPPGGPGCTVGLPPRSHSVQPLAPERYRIQLTAGAELKRKLELATDLLRHSMPSGDLAAIVERALDVLIEQTLMRRFGVKKSVASTTPSSGGVAPSDRQGSSSASAHAPTEHGRHIPNHVRRAVFERDEARCSWQAADGTRCNSRAWLEHDHAIPWAKGGPSDVKHVRLFCRAHNRLAAEQTYGRKVIDRIIARRQARDVHPTSATACGPGPDEEHPAQGAASEGATDRRRVFLAET